MAGTVNELDGTWISGFFDKVRKRRISLSLVIDIDTYIFVCGCDVYIFFV